MVQVSRVAHRGWALLELRSDELRVLVAPEKGGDVTSIRSLPTGTELLFQSPWGLRHRGAATQSGGSEARTTDWYPGGWQTMFPNAGAATEEHGVEWPYHGEVWATPFDFSTAGNSITMQAHLSRSPFQVTKRIALVGGRVTVTETIRNTSRETIEAMWGHHPAFGAPLLDANARIETTARQVWGDPALPPTIWPADPRSEGQDGADLSRVPALDSNDHRLLYLGDFGESAALGIINEPLGLRADVRWDPNDFPYAWYWLEAGGTAGYPYYSSAYVLGLEPCTSWPARGIAAARATTGTQVPFAPGQQREASIAVEVSRLDSRDSIS